MALRILADENIAASLVSLLRSEGFDVSYISEIRAGMTDDEVLSLAYSDGRVLLTEDRDFGEMVFRLKRRAKGIVLLRLPAGDKAQWPRVATILGRYKNRISGALLVVTPDRIRLRPLIHGHTE